MLLLYSGVWWSQFGLLNIFIYVSYLYVLFCPPGRSWRITWWTPWKPSTTTWEPANQRATNPPWCLKSPLKVRNIHSGRKEMRAFSCHLRSESVTDVVVVFCQDIGRSMLCCSGCSRPISTPKTSPRATTLKLRQTGTLRTRRSALHRHL